MKRGKGRGTGGNLPAILFFGCIAVMTALYLIVGYGAYLDSDMASELLLARQLVSERAPVSAQWYYSTEVRLLNTQLVFTPLMALFGGSWRLVRTLGCGILLALLAASGYYAGVRIGAQKRYALVFAGMTIGVCSPLYAQNVIIGAYYIPHAVLAFLMLGLCGSWLRGQEAWKPAALLGLCFVMGLSTVRYLLCAILPMSCALLWAFVFPGGDESAPRTGRQRKAALLGAGAAACGAIGYGIGVKLLPALVHYQPGYYASMGFADWTQTDLFGQLQTVCHGLLTALRFEGNVTVFGVQGILNMLVLLELFAGAVLLRRAAGRRNSEAACMGIRCFAFALAFSLAAFILLRSVYFDRYWLPVLMLGAPVMALCLSTEGNPVLRRLALVLFAGTMLLMSASTMFYSMRNPQVESEERLAAVEAARELGLGKGYATFWNANILTELSDGEVDVVSIEFFRREDGTVSLRQRAWLESERDLEMNQPDEPVFLLIGQWEGDDFGPMLERLQARQVEIDGLIDFYVIPAQRLLFEEMR